MPIAPARRAVLIEGARRFAAELATMRVPRRTSRGPGEFSAGVPRNAVARVVSFLRTGADIPAFRRFRDALPQVDAYEAQNATNSLLHYSTLANALREVRDPQTAEEWTFFLGWTLRMMSGDERR